MASSAKTKTASVYGALLHMYPQAFQKRYGPSMQQTLADMLEAEHSAFGRAAIWIRTLLDLPFSAAREHITDGKEISMNRNIKFLIAGMALAIVIVGVGSFWAGNLHSRQNVDIARVTTAQLADAMQQDHFYSDYGDAAVLFTGKVASVAQQKSVTLVTFATNRPYNVVCQFPTSSSLSAGQIISVAAPAGNAERQAHGVLLHRCLEN